MYEKIINYFETNLCIENIYFRKKYKLWIIGIIATFLLELIINYIVAKLISNVWIRASVILIIDFFITVVFLIFAYVLPINKLYKGKIKKETKWDVLGLLMGEEILSIYREIEIKEMNDFLKKKCKVNSIESMDIVINMIDEDLKDKYNKKSFIEKYFNNTILPILILILTIYFTNTNEQNLKNILTITIISIISIIITGNFITIIKNINITPVRKRENLLELKRVLIDLKIEWTKNYYN